MNSSIHQPPKTALITGISGQDGRLLRAWLLSQSYRVIGTTHRAPTEVASAGDGASPIVMPLDDPSAIDSVVETVRPDEVYHLAARSSSAQLFDDAHATAVINGLSAGYFLEAIARHCPQARYVQACSSEVFAGTAISPQNELTPFRPVNAYGAAKAYAAHLVAAYRHHHGLHASTAILFNHESPLRPPHYVTRKISHGVAMIASGQAHQIELGPLDSRRDWGYAGDHVRAMWLMTRQPAGGDYVVATGQSHSVRQFCELAFARVGLDYRQYVVENLDWVRRSEFAPLVGDPARAMTALGWHPQFDFQQLVHLMVDSDMQLVQSGISFQP